MKEVCAMCGKEIVDDFFEAKVTLELDRVPEGEIGTIVCSEECCKLFQSKCLYGGTLIDQYSRITGYYQKVAGWNAAKLQELKDRRRYGV